MANITGVTSYGFPILRYLNPEIDYMRAGHNATIEEAMAYIQNVVDAISASDSDIDVIFTEEYPLKNNEGEIRAPTIVWEIVNRQPVNTETRERPRQSFDTVDEASSYGGVLYGQRFDNVVQFTVFARTAKEANDTLSWFEELMYNWRGALTALGLQQVIERGRMRDEIIRGNYADSLQVRSTQWSFRTERLIKDISKKIERIYLEIHHHVKYMLEEVTRGSTDRDLLSQQHAKIVTSIVHEDGTAYQGGVDYLLTVETEGDENGDSYIDWSINSASPDEGDVYIVEYFYSTPYTDVIYESDPIDTGL